jgi:hypothetical protein
MMAAIKLMIAVMSEMTTTLSWESPALELEREDEVGRLVGLVDGFVLLRELDDECPKLGCQLICKSVHKMVG